MIKHEIEMVYILKDTLTIAKNVLCSISSLIHAIMKEGWKAVVN